MWVVNEQLGLPGRPVVWRVRIRQVQGEPATLFRRIRDTNSWERIGGSLDVPDYEEDDEEDEDS